MYKIKRTREEIVELITSRITRGAAFMHEDLLTEGGYFVYREKHKTEIQNDFDKLTWEEFKEKYIHYLYDVIGVK